MTSHSELIRNPVLVDALADAQRGSFGPLYAVLARLSGLPGPMPNLGLAEAIGRYLADLGPPADRTVAALAVPTGSGATLPAVAFFPICAAMAHAHQYLGGRTTALDSLRDVADDTRREVREGVVQALLVVGRAQPGALVEALRGWMGILMPASVALEALADRAVLDGVSRPECVLARLAEGVDLVAQSSRSDERTQGYRLLLRALANTTAVLLGRFQEQVKDWFGEQIAGASPKLRLCIERVLEQAPRAGASRRGLQALEQRMAQTAPPPRDPRTVVGPTRRRGKKRR